MLITKLSGENIKGRTFAHELGPITVFVGPNFSGKSARIDALRLALAGYLPELGKQNADTFSLASAPTMSVAAVCDAGSVVRHWSKKGDTISSNKPAPLPVPDVLLDAKSYFGLSAKERVNFVFRQLDASKHGFTKPQVIADIKNLKFDPHTAETEAATAQIVQKLGAITGEIRDWLESSVAAVKAQLSEATASAKRMAGTVQGLTQLKTQEEAASVSTERDLAAARQQLAELQRQLGALRASADVYDKTHAKRQQLQDIVSGHVDIAANLAEWDGTFKALEFKVRTYQSQTLKLKAKIHFLRESIEAGVRDVAAKDKDFAALTTSHESQIAHGKCPNCGWAKPEWLEELNANFKRRSAELAGDVASGMVYLAKWREELESFSANLSASEAADEIHAGDRSDRDAMHEELSEAKASQLAFESAKAQLTAMESMAPGDPEKIRATEVAITELQTRITALEAAQKRLIADRQERLRKVQAEEEYRKNQAEVVVLKATLAKLQETQAALVEAAFRPILERANQLCQPILRTPLAYKDGEVGRYEGGSWIPHGAFSGTEQAIAYAATSIALAADSPIKLCIIDELGRLDADNLAKFATLIKSLVDQGVIDQFVGACPGNPTCFGESTITCA